MTSFVSPDARTARKMVLFFCAWSDFWQMLVGASLIVVCSWCGLLFYGIPDLSFRLTDHVCISMWRILPRLKGACLVFCSMDWIVAEVTEGKPPQSCLTAGLRHDWPALRKGAGQGKTDFTIAILSDRPGQKALLGSLQLLRFQPKK